MPRSPHFSSGRFSRYPVPVLENERERFERYRAEPLGGALAEHLALAMVQQDRAVAAGRSGAEEGRTVATLARAPNDTRSCDRSATLRSRASARPPRGSSSTSAHAAVRGSAAFRGVTPASSDNSELYGWPINLTRESESAESAQTGGITDPGGRITDPPGVPGIQMTY